MLLGSGMMVLILSLSIGTGMTMTRKRSRFPTMITVATLGILSFSIYFLGLPMQMVLGVVSSSVLLVFPISFLSEDGGSGFRTLESKMPFLWRNCDG